MKKFIYLMVVAFAVGFSSVGFVSCEEDDSEYYASESEEDYKPNTYTMTSTWSFTGPDAAKLKANFEKECAYTDVYATRSAAVSDFDHYVSQVSTLLMDAGTKAELKLKRGNAVIKKANLTW